VVTDEEFAARMAALGPFEPAPRIAAGVSGGADSMGLALLAHAWARHRGGSLQALMVDHGLRGESRREATETAARLGERGIAAKVLVIQGLGPGPGLAERARRARFAALEAACAEAAILHLLLGHHAGDQAETLQIRALGSSGPAGVAGMAPLVETTSLRLLRPLLTVPPAQLRATLTSAGVQWFEDPSNIDAAALRPRLRLLRGDCEGSGSATTALVAASMASGRRRAEQDSRVAMTLAECVALRPEGFAVLSGQPIAPPVLAALVQTIAGAPYPPATRAVSALAAAPRPATLAGVRLVPAGRLGTGLLAVREPAAMAPPIPAQPGAVWDGRFRLGAEARVPPGATLGPLGDDAVRFRRFSPLPSAVLRTLPAVRCGSVLLAVPHLLYPDCNGWGCFPMLFAPPRPAAATPFWFGDA
jgi:tRNA(Ile)-lysidine synthase